MPRDFTLTAYMSLVSALRGAEYDVMPVRQALAGPGGTAGGRFVILRHDVDRSPAAALAVAHLERQLGVATTYYFRTTRRVFRPAIMREIEALGHEVGYHYEDLAACGGDLAKAWERFQANVARFRAVCSLSTICMHGRPLSLVDNRDLWTRFDYRALGIVGDPYIDLDFSRIAYLTDTGRRWDGSNVSVHDRVGASTAQEHRTTFDLLQSLDRGTFPPTIHMTTHPQRWTSGLVPWTRELLWQNGKNLLKRPLVVRNRKRM